MDKSTIMVAIIDFNSPLSIIGRPSREPIRKTAWLWRLKQHDQLTGPNCIYRTILLITEYILFKLYTEHLPR